MKKLTEGNPLTLLITFAIPILLGNIFQQLYSMVDIIIVSKTLGTTALAGVGATQSISGLIIGFTFGINSGFTILTAQYYGAGKIKEMKRTVAATLVLSLAITMMCLGQALTHKPQPLQRSTENVTFAIFHSPFISKYFVCNVKGNTSPSSIFSATHPSAEVKRMGSPVRVLSLSAKG